MRSHRSGADGVVRIAEVFWNAFFRNGFHSGPPRPLHQRRLRDFFLMSRPPLLCQEGSSAPNSFPPSYLGSASRKLPVGPTATSCKPTKKNDLRRGTIFAASEYEPLGLLRIFKWALPALIRRTVS